MRYSGIAASATALMAGVASAAVTGVTGKPEGFASSTTGGGDTAAVYPSTTDELVSYLGDDSARVIVLTKTFDFRGTEGTTTSSGCAPCMLVCNIPLSQQQQNANFTLTQGVLALDAKPPSTRTSGVRTTNQMLLPSPASPTTPLELSESLLALTRQLSAMVLRVSSRARA
jgi:hypothetical protein